MTEQLQFELVTPEKLAISSRVQMVEVPGELGDFGVLPGHAPFMSMIRPGVVTVHESEEKRDYYFIPAGYAEVNPGGCTILAEYVYALAEMTSEQIEKKLAEAKVAAEHTKDPAEKERAERELRVAELLGQAFEQYH